MGKYRDRIISLGIETGAKIILPEIGNSRINHAVKELNSMGFNILKIEDFQENIDIYLDYLNSLPFTNNWPETNLRKFINNPLHFGICLLYTSPSPRDRG